MRFLYFVLFLIGLFGLTETDLPDIDQAVMDNIICALALVALVGGLLGMMSKQSCDAENVMAAHVEKYHEK